MYAELIEVMRLIAAALLGGVIGLERQQRHKSAGLRTHILVSLGSCLVMLISYKLYAGVQGLTNADPARLAAQVVSGIGFLGAGTIMKEGLTIKGLTTAASLWVVAGVGLAVGAGYYVGAVTTTVLSVLALTYLPRFERLYGCVLRRWRLLFAPSISRGRSDGSDPIWERKMWRSVILKLMKSGKMTFTFRLLWM